MYKLLQTAARPKNFTARVKPFSGVTTRSLHTPLGSTKTVDESFQVCLIAQSWHRLSPASQTRSA